MNTKRPILIRLAKAIAPEDAKSWLDDMAYEMNFIKSNKLAWQIAAISFASKERLASINLRSPQNIAITSFALTAIFALVFVLPYKNSLVSPTNKAPVAITAPVPQTAVAPDREQIPAEMNRTARNSETDTISEAETSPRVGDIASGNGSSAPAIASAVETDILESSEINEELAVAQEAPIVDDIAKPDLKTDDEPKDSPTVANLRPNFDEMRSNTPSSETEIRGPIGPVGPAGAISPTGMRGPTGAIGPAGAISPETATDTAATAKTATATAIQTENPSSPSPNEPNSGSIDQETVGNNAANLTLSNELASGNFYKVVFSNPEILLKAKEDSFITVYSGIKADNAKPLLNRIVKKNEEIKLKAPVYIEVDNESNVLVNNDPIGQTEKAAVLIVLE